VTAPVLELVGVRVGYDGGTVIRDATLALHSGIHVLSGVNGSGKTTLIHTIAGLLPPRTGQIRWHGRTVTGWAAWRRARAGIGLIPQGRRVFTHLTVAQHLRIAARPGPWTVRRVLAEFPRLAERLRQPAGTLSGGEQQMLAWARALSTNPRLLLADEPTEGLSTGLTAQVVQLLPRLADAGMTVLVTTPDPTMPRDVAYPLRWHQLTAGRLTPMPDSGPAASTADGNPVGQDNERIGGSR
jgi:branched-chain amino acid transport system ATP-binding protein